MMPLLRSSLRTWLSVKGVWLVAAAALLPLVLTGAWVATHRADVTASGLELPDDVREGDNVTFRATIANTGPSRVDAFNATIAVGTVSGRSLIPLGSETIAIDGLDAGATREVTLQWTAQPGILFVVAFADQEDVLAEVDEYDNQDAKPLAVAYAAGETADAPTAPPAVEGDANATAASDLALTALARSGTTPGGQARLDATATNHGANATEGVLVVRVGRSFGGSFFSASETRSNVTLEPGASQTITLTWPAQEGSWWHEAWIEPGDGLREATPADNHRSESFGVDPTIPEGFQPPEIPEKLTIKEFYLNILELLHLRFVIPLVALFYAGGLIADEKERGSLPYILTRPIPRSALVWTKYASGLLVAGLVFAIGLLLTYLLLFQTVPAGREAWYLGVPLLLSLIALAVYGACFAALATITDRPYLVGGALILLQFATTIAFVSGSAVIALPDWFRYLMPAQYVSDALARWTPDLGFSWLPEGEGGTRAILILAAIAVGALIFAVTTMKKREFEV